VFGGSAVRLFGPQPHGPITSRFAAFVSTSLHLSADYADFADSLSRHRLTACAFPFSSEPRSFTAEIACLRLPVAFATQTGADPHRQAEIAEPDAISPSFIQEGEKRSDSENVPGFTGNISSSSAASAVRLKDLG
jgi:hypothetical protein